LASTVTESDDKDVNLSSILFPNPDVSHVQDSASSQPNIATMTKLIIEQFPLLDGMLGLDDIVQQLLSQRTSVATSVKCNTYNSNSDVTPVAICGDAAHATGVSGQGANSALMDTTVLAECLIQCYVSPSIEYIRGCQFDDDCLDSVKSGIKWKTSTKMGAKNNYFIALE